MEGQIPLEDAKRMEDLSTVLTVNFGSVEPGRKYTKEIRLDSIYEPTEIIATGLQNPLDKMISMKHTGNNKFTFTYEPTLPGQTTVDVYYLTFENKSKMALVAKGKTERTRSVLSKSRLNFATTDTCPVAEFLLILENVSDATDYFQWDAFQEYNRVTVEPKCGKLKPRDKIKIYIRVRPNHNGLFWRRIFCLMKFQEPLVLEISGVHTNDVKKPDLSRVIHLNESLPVYRTEFCKYVGDCWREIFLESRPLVAISHRYIHFGVIQWADDDNMSARVFTVTNNGLKSLTIAWEKDQLGVFSIEPEFSTIPSQNSLRFFAKFSPACPNQFYSTDLLAAIAWGSKLNFLVPTTLTIGLAGNSFSVNGCGWKLYYDLDRTLIVLPATVPGIPVYTTFKLTKTGQLPIFFRLYPADPKTPPECSTFLVKPMQGLVTDDFQIIVVQMFPGDLTDVEFIEEWIMCINTFNKVKLTFCGTCQLPYVLIKSNKLVEFPPTTIGVECMLSVPIRNTTRLNLKCKALMEPNALEFELGPNEQGSLPVHFNPKTGPREFNWAVALDVVWHHCDKTIDKLLQGQLITAQTVMRCFGRSVDAQIEGNPSLVTMNNFIIRRAGNILLKIQNNGEGVVYLGLTLKPSMFGTENALITIVPDELIIPPLESRQV